jgi:hypothetical protein
MWAFGGRRDTMTYMRIRRTAGWFIAATLLFSAPGAISSRACIVGNPAEPATITITSAPPDCCYGSWAGTVSGIANNLDTDSVVVVIYAQTNVYWVQPYSSSYQTYIGCDGAFSNSTHGGHHYCALLAKRSWAAPSTMGYLPPVGEDILAVACAPEGPRTLQFADYAWQVKQAGDVEVDPGPNCFSDRLENVWTDEAGRLHLKITHTGDNWCCAEVFTEQYLGFGLYEFEVESPIGQMDPSVVFAGFNYSDQLDEIDIEFSRWGNPAADNAQYVVQPWDHAGNRHRFNLALAGAKSCHKFNWLSDRVEFSSYQGGFADSGDVIQSWAYDGPDVPEPDIERMRFNLWLYNGAPPTDQQEVEVIVTDFRFTPAGNPVDPTTWGRIKAILR